MKLGGIRLSEVYGSRYSKAEWTISVCISHMRCLHEVRGLGYTVQSTRSEAHTRPPLYRPSTLPHTIATSEERVFHQYTFLTSGNEVCTSHTPWLRYIVPSCAESANHDNVQTRTCTISETALTVLCTQAVQYDNANQVSGNLSADKQYLGTTSGVHVISDILVE